MQAVARIQYLLLLLLPFAASVEGRIVGGEDVDIADFPWQGSYRSPTGSHTCGCVFVGGMIAISAAHCAGTPSHTMEFGATERGSGSVFGISIVSVHPQYGFGPGFDPNDIAVILSLTTISGPNIAPATMAPTAANPGQEAMITGWGRTCGSCALPVNLQGVAIDVIPDQECESRWGTSFDSASMICVYNGMHGACNGDSGGPLTIGSIVYGLTSWGATGCDATYPSVYTRVGSYKAWVCSVTLDAPASC